MNVTEIVKKLIGSVEPAGDSDIDEKRFENLKELCLLTSNLVGEISRVVDRNKNAHESSIQKIVQYADKFLKEELNIHE